MMIGRRSKFVTFSSLILSVLFGVLGVYAETPGNFLEKYGIATQSDIGTAPHYIYAGDDYFGCLTFSAESGVYRHYDKDGHQIWSSEGLGYNPDPISISRSGNRVLFHRVTSKEENYWHFNTEVFDGGGRHLFTCGIGDITFLSSPSGAYYYSMKDDDNSSFFYLLNSNGKVAFSIENLKWDAASLDDDVVVYIDGENLALLDAVSGAKLRQISMSAFGINQNAIYKIESSPDGQKIVLWNDAEIVVLSRNLEILGSITPDGRFSVAKFSNDSNSIVFLDDILSSKEHYAGTYLLNSKNTTRIKVAIPEGYKYAVKEGKKNCLFYENGLLLYTFYGRVGSGPEAVFNPLTLVSGIDQANGMAAESEIINRRIYPIGRSGNLIESCDGKLIIRSKEGGK